jgi:4-hydroxy-3-methylbut-2-enyl diphosphate reductase
LNILVADYSGFCFGVRNAVSTAYGTSNNNGRTYTYGPIIHNSTVVNELESKGIKKLQSLDELMKNDTVIIRSHGVPKDIINALNDKKVNIVDATCPYVDSIHKKVEDYYNKGYKIIIVGDPEHPEVQGINGWCNNEAVIINGIESAEKFEHHQKICANPCPWTCSLNSRSTGGNR